MNHESSIEHRVDNIIDVIDEESSEDQTGEQMPLLDTAQDIERPSQFWAIDPESDYDAGDNSSAISSAQMLKYVTKIKNETPPSTPLNFFETVVLINLAMLLYIATISFAKGIVMSKGINIASMAFFGFCSAFLFEQLTWTLHKCTSRSRKASLPKRISTPKPKFKKDDASNSPQGGDSDTFYS